MIAFRSAAHMNDENRVLTYTIDNSSSEQGSCMARVHANSCCQFTINSSQQR